MPSARWTAIVVAGGSFAGAAAAPATAADERAARDRPDDAVDLEPVRGLERAHRAPRLAAEDAVGGDPQRALHGRHVGPAAAELEHAGRAPGLRALRARRLVGRREHVAVISAAETSARFLRYAGVRRGGRLPAPQERASERSHSSGLPRSRRPGGCERIAQPSSCEVHAAMEPGAADGLMEPRGSRRRPRRSTAARDPPPASPRTARA